MDRSGLWRCFIACIVLVIVAIYVEMDFIFTVTPCTSLFNYTMEKKKFYGKQIRCSKLLKCILFLG
jgi:hypothetical protein